MIYSFRHENTRSVVFRILTLLYADFKVPDFFGEYFHIKLSGTYLCSTHVVVSLPRDVSEISLMIASSYETIGNIPSLVRKYPFSVYLPLEAIEAATICLSATRLYAVIQFGTEVSISIRKNSPVLSLQT